MSDFHLQADILRGQMVAALCDNPEQLVWVLAEIADLVPVAVLSDFMEQHESDKADVAAFYRNFADAIEGGAHV